MRPTVIEGHSPKPLAAPDGWDEERDGKCTALFVRPQVMGGVHFLRSAWEADPSEALQLLGGGKLILGIGGHCHPVVNLCVDQVPDTFAPVMTARQFVTMGGKPAIHVEMMFSTPDGPRIGKVDVHLQDVSYAVAVITGIEELEAFARSQGWIS